MYKELDVKGMADRVYRICKEHHLSDDEAFDKMKEIITGCDNNDSDALLNLYLFSKEFHCRVDYILTGEGDCYKKVTKKM